MKYQLNFDKSLSPEGLTITTVFDFEALLSDVEAQNTKSGLLSLVDPILAHFDIPTAIYLFIPREHLCNKECIAIHHWGYNNDHQIQALRAMVSLNEEIPFMSLRGYDLKAPFYGYQVPIEAPSVEGWNKKAEVYSAFSAYEGLIIPMIGLGVKEGYMGLGIKQEKITPLLQRRLHLIFQCLHQKYAELDALETHIDFNFSPREIELMMWLVAGKTQAFIAKAMKISPNTANGYLRNLFLKLKVDNRVKAAVKIDRLNLVVPHYRDLKSPEGLDIEGT